MSGWLDVGVARPGDAQCHGPYRYMRTAVGAGSRKVSNCTIPASPCYLALFRFANFNQVGTLVVVLLLR